ncbi:hypothetical protein EV714DRAFT_271213 [Schizophyllum commune]
MFVEHGQIFVLYLLVHCQHLSSFVNGPTPEQHLHQALDGVQKLLEHFAGDKSLNGLYSKTHACARDIRKDKNLCKWFDHTRKVFTQEGYRESLEARRRCHEMCDDEGESAQKWTSN